MKKNFERNCWFYIAALIAILSTVTGTHAAPSFDLEETTLSSDASIASPVPLLAENVSFDIFSASFFKAEENLLSLGDSYQTFKDLNFPRTRTERDGNRLTFQFSGLSLTYLSPSTTKLCLASDDEPSEDAYLSTISIDAAYTHRVILVLPTTGSILDLKLKSEGSSAVDSERLSTYLKKAKALFDKEFNETKTRVIKSELGLIQDGLQSYELLFETRSGPRSVILAADFLKGTLSIKIDLPSKD